jgi:ubiquinone/menaquinone biosynthesis C-methylase UbiE
VPDSLNFDRVAERYDETRGGEDRGERFARELDPLLDRSRPVVEIGVGTALVARGLVRLGHRVAGLDISEAMLRQARRRLGPRVALADARRLPMGDSTVPQAISVWVLHVVGDKLGVLAEVGRVLEPGARYIVVPGFTHDPRDPIGHVLHEMQVRADPQGNRRDDPATLRALAPQAGLRFVETAQLTEHDYLESPAQAVAKLEARSYSVLWSLPDDRWHEVAVPALEALRAMPDPEEPIQRRSSGSLVVLERPG